MGAQVIEGGNYDVDVTISSGHTALYKEQKKQYDQHTWTTEEDAEYRFCFSNEFSTVTHKVVYFDFQAGDDDPLREPSKSPLTAMTQVYMQLLLVTQVSLLFSSAFNNYILSLDNTVFTVLSNFLNRICFVHCTIANIKQNSTVYEIVL